MKPLSDLCCDACVACHNLVTERDAAVAEVERLVKRLDSIPGRGGMSRDGVIVSVDHDLIADARALLEKTKGEK
jgi:hypothetical protein